MAGQESWYLTRQINHFKQGLRWNRQRWHFYGVQNGADGGNSFDDAAVNSVATYIASLPVPNAESTSR
jgi:cytochrome c553